MILNLQYVFVLQSYSLKMTKCYCDTNVLYLLGPFLLRPCEGVDSHGIQTEHNNILVQWKRFSMTWLKCVRIDT